MELLQALMKPHDHTVGVIRGNKEFTYALRQEVEAEV